MRLGRRSSRLARSSAPRARSACAISSSALSPSRVARAAASTSPRRVAELEQPVARERRAARRRAGPRRARDLLDAVAVRAADLLAQLDDDPLGRALADPRHRLEARRVAGRDRADQLARRARPTAPPARPSGRPPGPPAASGTGRAPARSEKPYSASASSRTIRCVCSVASAPTAGTCARASAPRPRAR